MKLKTLLLFFLPIFLILGIYWSTSNVSRVEGDYDEGGYYSQNYYEGGYGGDYAEGAYYDQASYGGGNYSQGYYEGYYQGTYYPNPYSEGYYQGYYQSYYQGYYEGYYQSYYEGSYYSQNSYPYGYPTPYAYQTPGYPDPYPGLINPGEFGCNSSSECGGVNPHCCDDTQGTGSKMCSASGGPYCYNYQYQYPTPVYSESTYYPTPPDYTTPYSESTYYLSPASGMTGTLTPSSSTCTIAAGSSTCNINFSWSVTNPESSSAVTSNTDNSGGTHSNFQVATGHSGGPTAFTVPYMNGGSAGPRTFYLYNNAMLLDQDTVTASCASGSTWNTTSGTCVSNSTSCEWSAWSSWSSCTNGQQSRTRSCPNSCCTGSYIEYQACGGTCATPAISGNPSIISPGSSSVLSWCAPVACTGTSYPVDVTWDGAKATSGTQSVAPSYSTLYTITCGAQTASTTITVRNKPWFKED